jgi:DNA-binding XRE family transcriptional regulator
MVGHKGDNNSAPLNVNVLTTLEWSAARKLNIQQFMPRASLPKPVLDAIGRRLKLARMARGYGDQEQGKFAKAAGIETNTYNQWERGANVPNIHNAIQLCRKHELSLDWIYFGKTTSLADKITKRILELQAENPELRETADPTPAPPPPPVEAKVVRSKRGRRRAA